MEDIFDSRWFSKTKLFASIIGQWPFQSRTIKNCIRVLYHVLMWSAVPSMLRAFYLYWKKGKIEAVVLCIPPLLTLAGVTLKYNHYTINHVETKQLLERVRTDWMLISTMEPESRSVLEKYADIGRATVKFYSTYIYISLAIFISAPNMTRILNVIKPLNESRQTRLLYPMDYGEMGKKYHDLIMFHSCFGTILVINIFVACESIYMPLVFHCCGLFAVVGNRLERASTPAVLSNISKMERTFESHDKNMVCLRQHDAHTAVIVSCIKLHSRAIKYAGYLNKCYSTNFLLLVTMNMFLISVTGLQIALQIGLLEEIAAAAIYLCAQLLHLFFLSFPGQFLIDCSESVRYSAYNCPWFNLQANTQKLLVLIILRSMKPSMISAGSFFDLKMETFSSVVQTSMSYLTVLSSCY